MSQLVFDLVRKFSWEYRRANLAEFPFVCNICGPEERRFRKEKDQQKHDEMTKRHDPNFVPIRRPRKRRRRKAKINNIID
ncbi:unnamed protein product [Mytilus coruscus]|uniref:Uncharacterized protein n=1 Tax=Mytilus coruscus TaxID=42192 RepID=A0A6J8AN23_MYTCO|nr:unnamed protein product [Mytilus coruscus]